jgi:hypothetical protein
MQRVTDVMDDAMMGWQKQQTQEEKKKKNHKILDRVI